MRIRLFTGVALILPALAACQPASLEEAAKQRAIEIVEADIAGVQDVALTDVTIGADAAYRLHVCATASAANLPSKRIIADLESGRLQDDSLMRLGELTGQIDEQCSHVGMQRVFESSPEQHERWLAKL